MRHAWSDAEAQLLEQLAGDVPWPEALRRFRRAGRERGWPERSDQSIALRADRCGLRRRARMGEWTTAYGVGELLGCSGERVAAWLRNPEILAILAPRIVGRIRYISRDAWRRLAKRRPDVFGGFDADALFLLLEDRELADAVAQRHQVGRGDYRVRCIETGRVWPSCTAAARELHVTAGAISLSIRRGRKLAAAGLTFEALRKVG